MVDPSLSWSVVVEYQAERSNFAFSAFWRSVWLESVPVMEPHTPELMPSEDVETRSYAPFALPRRILPYVGAVEVPVPPKAIEIVELADTAPFTACKGPVSVPMEALPARRLVVLAVLAANEVAYRFVDVAFVVVAFVAVSPVIVASADENVSAAAVVNRAIVEKSDVEVAAVIVAREKMPPVTLISPVVVLIVKSALPLNVP